MSKQLKQWTAFLVIFSLVVTLCLPINGKAKEVSVGTVSAEEPVGTASAEEPVGTASAGEPVGTASAETMPPVETEPAGTVPPVETEPAKTVPPVETEPAMTVPPVETEPVETEPAMTVPPVETEPAMTVPPVETEPAMTVPPVETEPAKTMPPVETEPVGTEAPVETAPTETVPAGYIGIYDIGDLYSIRTNLSANYILMKDIDMSVDTATGGKWNLSGHGWTPIEGFRGTFDGNGHRIVGMHIYGEVSQNVGLFGTTGDVTIKNLGMINVDINVKTYADEDKDDRFHNNYGYYQETSGCIGGIVGYAEGEINIEKCYASGKIMVSESASSFDGESRCSVGGIVGKIEGLALSEIYYYTDFHGWTIDDVYNACDITVNGIARATIGGILGELDIDTYSNHFWYGYNIHCYCNNCYSIGTLQGATEEEMKSYPIIGRDVEKYYGEDYDDVEVTSNCYYLSGTAGTNQPSGCTSLLETQLKDRRTLAGFDFENIWEIDLYCDYPYPQLNSNRQIRIDSVDIVNTPDKTEYNQGDTLDVSGGTIKITYEDATTATIPITGDMVTGYDMNFIGEQNVIVTYCGKSVTYPIVVKEVPLTGIALNLSKASVYRSQSIQLSVLYIPANASNKTIEWTTSDATIATVDNNGLVTGKNKGTATIIATSVNGLTVQCEVEVLIPCATIILNETSADMEVGDTLSLTAQMLPLETTDVMVWKSDNTAVADVIAGTVTAYAEGTATITAYVEGGVSTTCEVIVKDSINSIISIKGKISSIKNTKKGSITLKLGKLGDADGYQVEYSLKSNFKNSKKIKKESKTITIKKLKKNKKYYVRVRVYGEVNGKTYYGKWSTKKTVRIKK